MRTAGGRNRAGTRCGTGAGVGSLGDTRQFQRRLSIIRTSAVAHPAAEVKQTREAIVMAVLTGRVHQARMGSRQRLAVVLLLGTSFMLSIDFSIMNVALPALGVSVGLKASELPWVISAYALPAAGFSLLFVLLAEASARLCIFSLRDGLFN